MATTYQLYIDLSRNVTVTVDKLGTFALPKGRYVYTGSARKNIESRVRRHLSKEKRLRWHIDYLLSHPAARITRIGFADSSECIANKTIAGCIVIPRFGASDCRVGCVSHLKRL